MFDNYLHIKDGDLLICNDQVFKFDSENGNPNSLKWFFKYDGFWNYIKAHENSIFDLELNHFITKDEVNSQGYKGLEFYKNAINVPSKKIIEMYNNL